MDLQKIIVLCAGVVVVAGAGWFVYHNNKPGETEEASLNMPEENVVETTTEDTTTPEDGIEFLGGIGSLGDLHALGKRITCTYSYSDNRGTSGSGVAYFDRERMRMESTLTDSGVVSETNIINDGTSLYTWSVGDEGTFAFKMPAGETHANVAPQQGRAHTKTLNEEVEYECSDWRVDESMFVPPQNIEFMDMETMMQEALQGFGGMERLPVPQ